MYITKNKYMTTEKQDINNELLNIINRTTKQPTILNESSNFVVVTYWWGKGNFNQNTARPCIGFYEDVIKKATKYLLDLINTAIHQYTAKMEKSEIITRIFNSYEENRRSYTYRQIIGKT